MFELIRKSILFGLGSAAVTRDAVESAVQKLVAEGKLNREEAEKLSEELVQTGEKEWEEIRSEIRNNVRRTMENLDLCSREEYLKLKEKVENLEKRLAILEDAQAGPSPSNAATPE